MNGNWVVPVPQYICRPGWKPDMIRLELRDLTIECSTWGQVPDLCPDQVRSLSGKTKIIKSNRTPRSSGRCHCRLAQNHKPTGKTVRTRGGYRKVCQLKLTVQIRFGHCAIKHRASGPFKHVRSNRSQRNRRVLAGTGERTPVKPNVRTVLSQRLLCRYSRPVLVIHDGVKI